MNLLALVQQATAEMGIPVPNYLAGNTSADAVQQLALMNAVGQELSREHPWQRLNTEYRFTTQYIQTTADIVDGSTTLSNVGDTTGVDSTWMVTGTGINTDVYVTVNGGTTLTISQAATASATGGTIYLCKTEYSLPSDFDRMTDRTMWDKSKHWEMLGPETPQQWQWLKSGYISTGPRMRYRVLGNKFQIWPPTASNEYLGWEYISTSWAYSVAGVGQSLFSADTDTCIFNDRLMILGLKKKYFEIKGFDTTNIARDYENEKSRAMSMDTPAATLSFAPRVNSVLVGWANIPDSGYGT